MKTQLTILLSALLFVAFALPSFAQTQEELARLDHYTPPPMFNTQGYDDASIRTSVGYKDSIEVETIDPRSVPQVIIPQAGFKPPLPPRRPNKVVLSKERAEQIKRQFQRGYTSEMTLDEDLVSPSAEDVLHTIDHQ